MYSRIPANCGVGERVSCKHSYMISRFCDIVKGLQYDNDVVGGQRGRRCGLASEISYSSREFIWWIIMNICTEHHLKNPKGNTSEAASNESNSNNSIAVDNNENESHCQIHRDPEEQDYYDDNVGSSGSGYDNDARSSERITPIQKIPDEQMYSNFKEWTKMATDNKINSNDNCKLELIDYFHEMTLLKEGDSINFQKTSRILDRCVKIYTSRVDSVATETGKLLSGLANSSDNDDNDDNDGDGDVDPGSRTLKKTTTTLAKDYSALSRDSILDVDLFDEVDMNPDTRLTEKDFAMAMVSNENESYNYSDSAFIRNWAGPEHWKLKRTNKDKGITKIGETRERKKKEPDYIDFIGSEDMDERVLFAPGGNEINAPKFAEEVSHGHLLPDDMHFSSKQFNHLFLKPKFMLNSKHQYKAQPEPDSDDEALSDMTIYTTEDGFYNDYDYDDDSESEFGDNLVIQTKINKPESIKYAKVSKRTDVKKLKENIWKMLADNTTFSGVTCDLKKEYPQIEMKDISVPLCFVSLLHLANEKNLEISNNDELTNLHIVN
ncbi:1521_t:CDS:10 [Funneliformis mosseae]|uniref:Condensin complex subunit 2 n=1 Tax=Funneliformis mosseae TaxID=27381 RepID=A0A9N9D577_FUNMO|nr:1521_t:CDS:10 [Funneliformis mosseae]